MRSGFLLVLLFLSSVGTVEWVRTRCAPAEGDWRVFVAPLGGPNAVCPADRRGALDRTGGVACLDACPSGTVEVWLYCVDIARDPDPIDRDVPLLPRSGGLAALGGILATACFVWLVVFTYGGLVVILSYALLLAVLACGSIATFDFPRGVVSVDHIGWITKPLGLVLLALGATCALALVFLTDALLSSASIARKAARSMRCAWDLCALAVAFNAARTAVAVRTAQSVGTCLARAASVSPVRGSLVWRSVSWAGEPDDLRLPALAGLCGLWCVVALTHLCYVSCCVHAARQYRCCSYPPLRRRCAAASYVETSVRHAGLSVAAGATVVVVSGVLVATLRYIYTRTATVRREVTRHRALWACCSACANACASAVHVAIPIVYSSLPVFGCGGVGGLRRTVRLARMHPVLFTVLGFTSFVLRALNGLLCGLVGGLVAWATGVRSALWLLACAVVSVASGMMCYRAVDAALNVALLYHAASHNDDLLLIESADEPSSGPSEDTAKPIAKQENDTGEESRKPHAPVDL